MHNTKLVVLGGILACISALFQILPTFLSEAFIILTIFSALPVYLLCRISPKIGITATIASFVVVSLFSIHESLFFLFTNGPIGASLGCFNHSSDNKKLIISATSIVLCITLCIMNFIIGIPIFGTTLPGTLIVQIIIILAFSLIYSFIYLHFCDFTFRKLKKYVIN